MGQISRETSPMEKVIVYGQDHATKIVGDYSLVTKNRRGHPSTTDRDEFIDGKPTGRIVSAIRFEDDHLVYEYHDGDERWVDSVNNSHFFLEGDGVHDKEEIPSFLNDTDGEEICEIISTLSESLAHIAELTETSTFHDAPTTCVVEFDWQMGHEVVECSSVSVARGYRDDMLKQYPWAVITNYQVFKEQRIREEI